MRCLLSVTAVVSLACLSALVAASQTAPASPLDGTKWIVKVTPDAAEMKIGEKAFDDTLVFESGKVSMTECAKVGFMASAYGAKKDGDGWSFRTEQTSATSGKSHWTAGIKGDAISGKLVMTKSDGTVLNYTFAGKKGT